MRFTMLTLALAVAFVVTGCGDDTATTVGDADGATDDGAGIPDDSVDNLADDTDAEPLGAGPHPVADLMFTVQAEGPDGVIGAYRLACLGDTATLTGDPAPAAATTMCLALLAEPVVVRLTEGPPTDQMCTQIFGGPELARVTGALDGAPVDTEFHRRDGCGIADWDMFAGLLPATT